MSERVFVNARVLIFGRIVDALIAKDFVKPK